METAHWGLVDAPFGNADSRPVFNSPGGEEALARLQFLVEEGRRLGILTGPFGGGKTTLLGQLANDLRRDGAATSFATIAGLAADELVWQLAADLGANPDAGDPPFRLWRRLADRIVELRYERNATVLLLDDVDRATSDALALIDRLVSFGPAVSTPLTIVLAFDSEHSPIDARLARAADLRVNLAVWDENDTAQYVAEALSQAGATTDIFEESAIARLFELSGGLPRRVNQLAELALLAAAAQEAPQVDASIIEAAAEELNFD